MKPLRNTKGFTTAELLITMIVLIILASIAIPYFAGNMPRYRLNGAVRQLMGDLMWCRMESVSRNHRHRVQFLGDHTYSIFDLEGATLRKTVNIQNEYPDVTLSSTGNPTFNGRGAASWPTSIITLTNSSGSKQVIVRTTGHVKIN